MIRKAGKDDLETLANLAAMLYSNSADELIAEFSETVSNEKSQFFLNYENDLPIGFAQCQLRCDYVEGTSTSPVGYLEGIFIRETCRGNLPVTVKLRMQKVSVFIKRCILQRQTGSSVSQRHYSVQVCRISLHAG